MAKKQNHPKAPQDSDFFEEGPDGLLFVDPGSTCYLVDGATGRMRQMIGAVAQCAWEDETVIRFYCPIPPNSRAHAGEAADAVHAWRRWRKADEGDGQDG